MRSKPIYAVACLLLLTGCSTRPMDPADGGADADGVCTRTVSGEVRFPNGELPVSGAVVYVAAEEPQRVGECGQCVRLEDVAFWQLTGADGTFHFDGAAPGPLTLFVEKGGFQRRVEVEVPACGEVVVDPEHSRLPHNGMEGRVPRIAVLTGDFDHMENVLAELGLAEADALGRDWITRSFDLYGMAGLGPGYPPSLGLLTDRDALLAYDYVFINCGSDVETDALANPTVAENLRAFVAQGGRLYVTDQSYDYVEHVAPAVVDFEGDEAREPGSPEAQDAAQVGDFIDLETPIAGAIHDEKLADWLRHLDALEGDSMPIGGLAPGWAVIAALDPERARSWVSAEVSWLTDPEDFTSTESGTRPLTITFEIGCGRVLFTSYHTVEESSLRSLIPQELVLAYLALEIGACIEDPGLI